MNLAGSGQTDIGQLGPAGPAAAGRTRTAAALPASTNPIYKRIPSLIHIKG